MKSCNCRGDIYVAFHNSAKGTEGDINVAPTLNDARRARTELVMRPYLPFALLLTVAAGCAGPRPAAVATNQRQPWYGETMPMGQVAAAITRNNEMVPTLWARHDY